MVVARNGTRRTIVVRCADGVVMEMTGRWLDAELRGVPDALRRSGVGEVIEILPPLEDA